jgi:hypothetical protein
MMNAPPVEKPDMTGSDRSLEIHPRCRNLKTSCHRPARKLLGRRREIEQVKNTTGPASAEGSLMGYV